MGLCPLPVAMNWEDFLLQGCAQNMEPVGCELSSNSLISPGLRRSSGYMTSHFSTSEAQLNVAKQVTNHEITSLLENPSPLCDTFVKIGSS